MKTKEEEKEVTKIVLKGCILQKKEDSPKNKNIVGRSRALEEI